MAGSLLCYTLCTNAQDYGALKYAIQKVPGNERFPKGERFSEHMFFSTGISPFMILTNGNMGNKSISLSGNMMVGKWLTPVHGLRIGLQAGYIPTKKNFDTKTKLFGGTIDYLMNISALAYKYDYNRFFEVVGVAGIDLGTSWVDNNHAFYGGGHLGLQTKFHVSPTVDFFVEPRLLLYTDGVDQIKSWRGYKAGVGLMAGVTYNIVPMNLRRSTIPFNTTSFLNNTFMSFSTGVASLITRPIDLMGSLKNVGPNVNVGMGKWFTPASGVRLSVGGGVSGWTKDYKDEHFKHITARVDYLLNLNSIAAGYDAERFFNLIAIAGLNYSLSKVAAKEANFSPGVNVGVQGNFRLNRSMNVFVEPRASFYKNTFAAGSGYKKMDILAELNVGVNYNALPRNEIRERNVDFDNSNFFNNIFITTGFGAQQLISKKMLKNLDRIGMKGAIGIGKWFTPTSGARLTVEGGFLGSYAKRKDRHIMGAFSADYLWNITAAMSGYNPERKVGLIGSIGMNAAYVSKMNKGIQPGVNIGLQGLWHLNDFIGIYVEPQVRLYGDDFAPGNAGFATKDILGSINAGVQFNMQTYDKIAYHQQMKESDKNMFFSVAAGPSTFFNKHVLSNMGVSSQVAVGKWYSPLSGWRAGLGIGRVSNKRAVSYIDISLDYMMDLGTLARGYDADRFFTLIGLAGVNIGTSYTQSKFGVIGGANVGLQGRFRINDQLDLFAEPRLNVYNEEFDQSKSNRHFDPVASMNIGFNYYMAPGSKIKERNTSFNNKSFYNNFFITLGLGPQLLLNKGMAKNAGYTGGKASIGIGKWFTSTSGARLTAEGGGFASYQKRKNWHIMTTIAADYLWNISSTVAGNNPDRKFELIGSAGVNASYVSEMKNGIQPGVNIGLQGLWHLNDFIGLYLEPQLRIYNDKFAPGTTGFASKDMMAAINVGMQFRMKAYDRTTYNRLMKEASKNMFISVSAGPSALFNKHFINNIGISTQVAIGKWYTPLSGWRISSEIGRLESKKLVHYTDFSFDYLMDLGTLAQGYDADRFFNLIGIAGVNAGVSYSKRKFGLVGGVNIGLQGKFRVNERLELFAEPKLNIFNEQFDQSKSNRHFDPIASLHFGVNYKMNITAKGKGRSTETSFIPRNFVGVSAGMGLESGSFQRTDITPTADIYVGRTITPLSAVRAGVRHFQIKPYKNDVKVWSAHIDYMLNINHLISDYNPNRTFNVYAIAGLNYNFPSGESPKFKVKGSLGGEVGIQTTLRISSHFNLYAEPMLRIYNNQTSGKNSQMALGASLSLGTTYTF